MPFGGDRTIGVIDEGHRHFKRRSGDATQWAAPGQSYLDL